MGDREARNLIQEEICLKMLGPGYAKDLILCSDDARDEIIPDNPKTLYSTGMLVHDDKDVESDVDNLDNLIIDDIENNEDNDAQDIIDDSNDNSDVKKFAGSVENSDAKDTYKLMKSHIGLITCVSKGTECVRVSVDYGTYKKLTWEEIIEKVKVNVGKYSKTMDEALESFSANERLSKALEDDGLPTFKECFEMKDGYLSVSSKMSKRPTRTLNIPNDKYPVEASLVNILLSNHYQRTHHLKEITIDLKSNDDKIVLDENTSLRWNSFDARGKKFLKILLTPQGEAPIFQPQISVEVPENYGCIESYVEPITSLEDDKENNINEFVYRKVLNYGKGVNCALDWTADGKKVFTTYMPVSDIEKFSSDTMSYVEEEATISSACQLRNLSIWSELEDKKILGILSDFVDGYGKWHDEQMEMAQAERENYPEEVDAILSRQKELLERLTDNVNYLRENNEAFTCFKIANTAMLLQMVVARHPDYEKGRDVPNYDENITLYKSLDFFRNGDYTNKGEEPKYYPFQLAFLLMNVKSTFEQDDKYRKEVVDLIWFPTGGGKTEAYLALTALTIVHRRRRGMNEGVSVIMRYTLRMLASQQFERASYLICALEMLRTQLNELTLGTDRISIGLYVGGGVTPNRVNELVDNQYPYRIFFSRQNQRYGQNYLRDKNPFPIVYCPWCGCTMVGSDNSHGYGDNGSLRCLNNNCHYHDNDLPIYYIDENIYNRKPTLLFATVDKFANLANGRNSALLKSDNVDSPDLIIQDELHLLTGALGSIVGLFESVVELLCTKDGKSPKIIASTATTRNTHNLIKGLYGKNREVSVFPAQGLEYNDNCFSHVVEGAKRRHIGIMPSIIDSTKAEIRLAAWLMLARVKLFKKYVEENQGDWLNVEDVNRIINNDGELVQELDNYWTTVFYFNSLKDLGRSRSRVFQEVREVFRGHQNLYTIPKEWNLLKEGFDRRVFEFTSRIESRDIRGLLEKAGQSLRITNQNNENLNVESGSDLIYASNMISVGIDISRWNLMVMVGQPRSTSEYVQSSSRVARKTYGLVVNLLNPIRLREHSVFENYKPFHSTYYKLVEPLSVTPLTYATIKHNVLMNIIDIYRGKIIDYPSIDMDDLANQLLSVFKQRFDLDNDVATRVVNEIINIGNRPLANSLRDITKDTFMNIEQVNYQ